MLPPDSPQLLSIGYFNCFPFLEIGGATTPDYSCQKFGGARKKSLNDSGSGPRDDRLPEIDLPPTLRLFPFVVSRRQLEERQLIRRWCRYPAAACGCKAELGCNAYH